MKRALMYASVASMIQQFNMENIRLLQQLGYEVDVACNMEQGSTITNEKIVAMRETLKQMGVETYHVPVPRKATAFGDVISSIQITRDLIRKNQYALIHCHSPIGGMVCRIANRISGVYKKAKMIYTAHGFHFFKGASWKNWLIYYPVERFCSRFTDLLLTINQEDYAFAKKKLYAKEIKYIPGIGVDVNKFSSKDGAGKRQEFGIADSNVMLLSVGELSVRKNHEVILRALAGLTDCAYQYFIVGLGAKKEYLENLAAELGIGDRVHLLGYRTDVAELLNACDLFAFPSLQEGLPVALMEAMSVGKAVVCSSIRGNTDLVEDGVGGYLVEPKDVDGYRKAMQILLKDDGLRTEMGCKNKENVQQFSMETINRIMFEVYKDNI